MSRQRILWDRKHFQKDPPPNISAGPLSEENMFHWQAIIMGPPNSPYAGGVFFLTIVFPPDYPLRPPRVRFQTKIYHPNINHYGAVDLDVVREKWSPAFNLSKVLSAIYSLLTDPVLENPLVSEIAQLYQADRSRYEANARNWTEVHAMG